MPVFLHFASDFDKSVQELSTQTELRENPRRELYFGAQMNFYPYVPHSLPDYGEI
jgi:hypothetical protein